MPRPPVPSEVRRQNAGHNVLEQQEQHDEGHDHADSPQDDLQARVHEMGWAGVGPCSLATTMRRWAAEKRGLQVVRVSRSSLVFDTTCTAVGATMSLWSNT